MAVFPMAFGAVCVALMIAADARGEANGRAAAKVLAALGFLAQLAIVGSNGHVSWTFVALGLLFSLLGDIALISREKRPFLLGIGAFLAAHVAYILSFLSLGADLLAFGVALVGLGLGTGALASRFVPKAGSLAPAVAAYIVVITIMGAAAVGAAVAAPRGARVALAVAAIAFMASDICVARDRFEHTGSANRAAGWVMYFGAQYTFAWAIASA